MAVTSLHPTILDRASNGFLPQLLNPTPWVDAAVLARQLASGIADRADADQWAVAIVGIEGTGAPDFDELIPRAYLEAMNDGRPARYRLTLVLQTEDRDLGVVRLSTLRPTGFSDLDVARARRAAENAARRLDEALGPHSCEPKAAA